MTARGAYLSLATALIGPGVVTKLYVGPGAAWVANSFGGVLYVLFWIFVVLAARPDWGAGRVALGVLAVTSMLEVLQLWHPAWLAPFRTTFLGHALLGNTFAWLDFPHYAAGALLGWMLGRWVRRLTARHQHAGSH